MIKKDKGSKFILPTKENVEQYTLEHFDTLFESQKQATKEIFSGLEDLMPPDDKIKSNLEQFFKTDRLNNYKTFVPCTNNDYYSFIENIQESSIEKLVVILLDENKQPFDSKIVEKGNSSHVGDSEYPYNSIFKFILENKNCKYFIIAHNHPDVIYCTPSTGDYSVTYNVSMLGNVFNVKMLDSVIISEFDFYSQYEYEKGCHNSDKLLKPDINKKAKDILFDEEKMLYRFLTRCLKDGL